MLNSSGSVKEDSFVSINMKYILLRFIRRVVILSYDNGQWKKNAVFTVELQSGLISTLYYVVSLIPLLL